MTGASAPGRVAAATIVPKDHLALARVLVRSLLRHHPEIHCHVLVIDEPEGLFDPQGEPFRTVGLPALDLPDPESFRFRYTKQQLSYACTPFLLRHLLQSGFDRVLFVKEESLVLGRMSEALERLTGCPVLMTPHLLAPLESGDVTGRELEILQAGAYNCGLLGVSESEAAHRFLTWWCERMTHHCVHAVGEGMHFEQRWLDLAPSYFEGVEWLRDPTYNVAHWNLPERRVTMEGGEVWVEGRPCRLFRFSGYDVDHPRAATRYFTRLRLDDLGDAARVYDAYREQLEKQGHAECRSWPYGWGRFDDGTPIPDVVREIHRRRELAGEAHARPFSAEHDGSFQRWLLAPACEGPADAVPTNLWHEIWKLRTDLQAALPDPLGLDRERFVGWIRGSASREHGVPQRLCGAVAAGGRAR